jgi:hypothetical protein
MREGCGALPGSVSTPGTVPESASGTSTSVMPAARTATAATVLGGPRASIADRPGSYRP